MKEQIENEDIRMYKRIRETIRSKRLEYKLSQSELAKLCGVSKGHISQIETGKKYPALTLIRKIYSILDINEIELTDVSQTDILIDLKQKHKIFKTALNDLDNCYVKAIKHLKPQK